jgi:hypothetical protein
MILKKFRLKIESTDEYQAQYIREGFGKKDIDRLLRTVKREVWTDTGKKEGVHSILTDGKREFVWMYPWMLEEIS